MDLALWYWDHFDLPPLSTNERMTAGRLKSGAEAQEESLHRPDAVDLVFSVAQIERSRCEQDLRACRSQRKLLPKGLLRGFPPRPAVDLSLRREDSSGQRTRAKTSHGGTLAFLSHSSWEGLRGRTEWHLSGFKGAQKAVLA